MTVEGHVTRQPIGVLEHGLMNRRSQLAKHGVTGPKSAFK